MNKTTSSILLGFLSSIFFIGLFVFISIHYRFFDFLSSRVTTYSVLCDFKVIDNKCSSPAEALSKTTFKILKNQQKVLYRSTDGTVKEYANCVIEDRKHWTCHNYGALSSNEVGFKNGYYFENYFASDGSSMTLMNLYYPSGITWDYLKIREWVR